MISNEIIDEVIDWLANSELTFVEARRRIRDFPTYSSKDISYLIVIDKLEKTIFYEKQRSFPCQNQESNVSNQCNFSGSCNS